MGREGGEGLEQRERVPASLGKDPVTHGRIHRTADRRIQDRARVNIAQPLHDKLRKPGQLLGVARLAYSEH